MNAIKLFLDEILIKETIVILPYVAKEKLVVFHQNIRCAAEKKNYLEPEVSRSSAGVLCLTETGRKENKDIKRKIYKPFAKHMMQQEYL